MALGERIQAQSDLLNGLNFRKDGIPVGMEFEELMQE
jgi:hypothetical protein